MNSDHYTEIGLTHRICQDYALSGTNLDFSYAIISDGCSGAEHSEIGAQILCHTAKYYLELYFSTGLFFKSSSWGCSLDALSAVLAKSIYQKADELRKGYVIDPAALQATLFLCAATKECVYLFGWGDGIIIEHFQDHNRIIEIEYPSNAPFYLVTDPDIYQKKYGYDIKVTHRSYNIKTHSGQFDQNEPVENQLPFNNSFQSLTTLDTRLLSVTLCSDGLKSYKNNERNSVNILSMVPKILDYPDHKGQFVQRNMIFLKKEMDKKSWSHHDDISCACVAL
jgi:serine/threonine protein phosphatase PrpC